MATESDNKPVESDKGRVEVGDLNKPTEDLSEDEARDIRGGTAPKKPDSGVKDPSV